MGDAGWAASLLLWRMVIPHLQRGAVLVAIAAVAMGCGEDEATDVPTTTTTGGEGGAPVALVDPCPADEVPVGDGTCSRPGMDADDCGEGFELVDGGCQPVLPTSDCEPGTMAVPGESACREVAPCGEGTWGDIPADAIDEHVDASYTGGASDGSADHPWTTIGAALTAAEAGATIAIAEGSYVEDVFVHAKADLRLWGRCPQRVSITGLDGTEQPATVFITDEAPGTTLRGLAITGPGRGIETIAQDTLLEQVWIHDTGRQGIYAVDSFGPSASVTVRDSLIEKAVSTALFAAGSDAVVERSVIRDTRELEGELGRGLYVDRSARADATEETASASLEVRSTVLRRNRLEALRVDGAEATIEDTAILDTQAQTLDDDGGAGLSVLWHEQTGARSSVSVARTAVVGSRSVGVWLIGSDVTLEAVSILDTQPDSDGRYGRGLEVQGSPVESVVAVRRSVIDSSVGAGALVGAAAVTFEDCVVRQTSPEPDGPYTGQYGFGITAQSSEDLTAHPTLTVRRCLVQDNHVAGVSLFGGQVLVEASRIERTAPSIGLFGDGVLVYNYRGAPSSGQVDGSIISDNARVGVAAFGASVSLGDSLLRCNAVDLNGEQTFDNAFDLVDEGHNACGCDTPVQCQAATGALAPPDPP